jgi:hypothetical protein
VTLRINLRHVEVERCCPLLNSHRAFLELVYTLEKLFQRPIGLRDVEIFFEQHAVAEFIDSVAQFVGAKLLAYGSACRSLCLKHVEL